MTQNKLHSFRFYTLGCKLNFAESSSLASQLLEAGFQKAEEESAPDICIVNTCTVTDVADKKCRQTIHKIKKQYPQTYMVVTGCYAQLNAPKIQQMEGVDLVLGANDKFALIQQLKEEKKLLDAENQTSIQNSNPNESSVEDLSLVSETRKMTPFFGSYSHEDRTRHFLKVQDGCDYFCTYCAIPFARGRSRNGKISDLVAQAQKIAQEGGKEIILTGVNIGDFGKSTGETCLDLIKAMDTVEGIERIRISSIEPNLLTDEIIEFVAQSKRFAPHFHIPLQAGSDEVLKLMHRRYNSALFAHKVQLIKSLMPNAFIGVDVIVGMRGETEELFETSRQFIESLDVTELHVFSYSERRGTAALRIPHVVSPEEKKLRSHALLAISHQKKYNFYQNQIGTTKKVLWEAAHKDGKMFGFTENYVRLSRAFDPTFINQIETVTVTANNLHLED